MVAKKEATHDTLTQNKTEMRHNRAATSLASVVPAPMGDYRALSNLGHKAPL